jgi:hypothetical protein
LPSNIPKSIYNTAPKRMNELKTQVRSPGKHFSSGLGGDTDSHPYSEPEKKLYMAVELIIANKFIKLKFKLHSCMIDIATAKYILHIDWPPPRDQS